jgi:hypothetical protein
MSALRIFELLHGGANERDIINVIDIFVSKGGDINVIGGGDGVEAVKTILELAIIKNYKSVVKHLLNSEYLEIDKSPNRGILPTPLWLAVSLASTNRDEDISIDLINKGANTNIKSNGLTLLKYSEIFNLHRVVALLNPIPCPHDFPICSKISEGGDGYCYNESNVGRYVNRLNPRQSCNKDFEGPESEITGDSNLQKASNSDNTTPLLESFRGGGKNKSNINKSKKNKHKRKYSKRKRLKNKRKTRRKKK